MWRCGVLLAAFLALGTSERITLKDKLAPGAPWPYGNAADAQAWPMSLPGPLMLGTLPPPAALCECARCCGNTCCEKQNLQAPLQDQVNDLDKLRNKLQNELNFQSLQQNVGSPALVGQAEAALAGMQNGFQSGPQQNLEAMNGQLDAALSAAVLTQSPMPGVLGLVSSLTPDRNPLALSQSGNGKGGFAQSTLFDSIAKDESALKAMAVLIESQKRKITENQEMSKKMAQLNAINANILAKNREALKAAGERLLSTVSAFTNEINQDGVTAGANATVAASGKVAAKGAKAGGTEAASAEAGSTEGAAAAASGEAAEAPAVAKFAQRKKVDASKLSSRARKNLKAALAARLKAIIDSADSSAEDS